MESLELTIDADGRYALSFSFEKPKRLNGILDHNAFYKFSNYADVYGGERDDCR